VTSAPTRRVALAALLTGLVVFGIALVGLDARATYGAQVTSDEPQYLLSAISVFEDRGLDISDELRAEAWRHFHEATLPQQTEVLPDGRELSPHDPGLPLLLALPTGLGGWVAAKALLAAVAGLLAGVLVWLAHRRLGVPLVAAAVVAGVFGASAPLAVYATQVYPEIVAAMVVAVGLVGTLGSPPRRTGIVLTTLAVLVLPWLAVKYVPVAAVLAVALLWRLRTRRGDAALVGLALVVGASAYVLFHQVVYGGWTPYATGRTFTGGEFTVVGRDPDYLGRTPRLLGLWVDRGFGIAAWQPAYLLAFPALGALVRRRPAGWAVLLGVAASGWLVATFVALTMHGWWAPGRQVVVVLPAVVLVVAWWVGASRARLAWTAGLGGVGVLTYLLLVIEASTGRLTMVVDFATTANPIYRAWRQVLPDYQVPTATTWVLHAGWLVIAAALAWWGWHSAARPVVDAVGGVPRPAASTSTRQPSRRG